MEIIRTEREIAALKLQAEGEDGEYAKGVAAATKWITDSGNRTDSPFKTTPQNVVLEDERAAVKAAAEQKVKDDAASAAAREKLGLAPHRPAEVANPEPELASVADAGSGEEPTGDADAVSPSEG